jgi:PAS domain S-box-containing protein
MDSQRPPLVVVVNDDPLQLTCLGGLLKEAGYETRTYGDAETALKAMSALGPPPDLVVTDVYMPGIDGWRFCRLLRSAEYLAFNDVPILVVSAIFAGDEPAQIAKDIGADSFMAAPVDGEAFLARIEALRRGERQASPLKILIVEDSPSLSNLMRQRFSDAGFSVTTAGTLEEAKARLEASRFEVALVDYHLPDGVGASLLEWRAHRCDGCAYILMTTDPDPELALSWMKAGGTAYVRKPFDFAYLIELCAKVRRERALMRSERLLEERTRELTESERRLRLAMEVARMGHWRFDCATQQIEWFGDHHKLFGIAHSDFAGTLAALQKMVHPEDRARGEANLRRTIEEGVPFDNVYRVVFPDGTIRWLHSYGRLNPDVNGRPDNVFGVTQDITSLKRAEEEQKKLQAQLAQAQKLDSIGRLAGGVAHDFNNMLGVMLGHAEMAMETLREDDPLRADLQSIRDAANRSADLTRQLLAFARKQTISPRVLDLNESVKGMLGMLRRLIGENVALAWQPGSEPARVEMDPTQVDQLLVNLCVNARDAVGASGKIVIETCRIDVDAAFCASHPDSEPGRYARLSVIDNGSGMDAYTLSKLFEPFFTTKGLGKGTGLGLSTVYGIVKQNHGFIEVASEPGKGSVFHVYLPLAAKAVEDADAWGGKAAVVEHHETLLLVEDDSANLQMAKRMLASLGYRVLAANGAEEAMALARESGGGVDCLLTDVVMPGMNGFELSKRLSALFPGMKCLYMSGHADDILNQQGTMDPAMNFISKPFGRLQLGTKLHEVLSAQASMTSRNAAAKSD